MVDRDRLLDISGRGRERQLRLAKMFWVGRRIYGSPPKPRGNALLQPPGTKFSKEKV